MNNKLLLVLIISIIVAICIVSADSRSTRRSRKGCRSRCRRVARRRCRTVTNNGGSRCRRRHRRRCRRKCRRRVRRRRRRRRRRTRRSGSCTRKCKGAKRVVNCIRNCRVARSFRKRRRSRRVNVRKTVRKTVTKVVTKKRVVNKRTRKLGRCACKARAIKRCGAGKTSGMTKCRRRMVRACRKRCRRRVRLPRIVTNAKCPFGYSKSRKCSNKNGRRVCRVTCKEICCGPKEKKRMICNKKACGCSAKATAKCGSKPENIACRKRVIKTCRKTCNGCRNVCVRRRRCKKGQTEVRKCTKGSCRVHCVRRGCPVGTRRVKLCNGRTKRCRAVCRKTKTKITIKVRKDCFSAKCNCNTRAAKRCINKDSTKRQSCVKRFVRKCRRRCAARKVCKTVKKRACPEGKSAVRKCAKRGKNIFCKVRCVSRCRSSERKVKQCTKKGQCYTKCVSRCGKGFRKIRKCKMTGFKRSCKSACVRRCPSGSRIVKGRCTKRRCRKGQKLVSRCGLVSRRCDCHSKCIATCGMGLHRKAVRCRRRKMRRCKRKCATLSKTRKCKKVCITQKKKRTNCAKRVISKCGSKPSKMGEACRTKHMRRCKRRVKGCLCRARAVRRCGLEGTPASKRCRRTYRAKCYARCKARRNCRTVIRAACKQHKRGSLKRKNCVRRVAKAKCGRKTTKKRKNCEDCRKVAVKKCGTGLTGKFVRCRDNAYEQCKRRCSVYQGEFCTTVKGMRKCYDYSCKDSNKQCAAQAVTSCVDASDKDTCVKKQTAKCSSVEFKKCRKARRRVIFKDKCHKKAMAKCGPASSKAACRKQFKTKCYIERCRRYRIYKKHHVSCRRRTSIICSKRKGSEASRCRRVHRRRCVRRRMRRRYIQPPVCVNKCVSLCGGNSKGECFSKQMRKCTRKWLSGYCERKSYYDCDADLPCMKFHIEECTKKLPKCVNKKELCDDKNACTNDICHPEKGCLHIKKRCTKKSNKCFTSKCDPIKGCTYTAKNCDDKIACTKDTCNSATGKCEHKEIHTRCQPKDECQVGVCTRKGCTFAKNPSPQCKKVDIPKLCKKKCQPRNACETVKCEVDKNLRVKCVRKSKSCDDGLSCTQDSCHKTKGCVNKFRKSAACKSPCAKDLDCAKWGVDRNLEKSCQTAVCDRNLGTCKAVLTKDKKQRCAKDDCPFKCKKEATKECGEFTRNFHTCEQVAKCVVKVNSTCIERCEKKAAAKDRKPTVVVEKKPQVVSEMKKEIAAEKKVVSEAKAKIVALKSMKKVEKESVKEANAVEEKDKETLSKMKKDKMDKRDIKMMKKQVVEDTKKKIVHKNQVKSLKKQISSEKKLIKTQKVLIKKNSETETKNESHKQKVAQDSNKEKKILQKEKMAKAAKESAAKQDAKESAVRKEFQGETCESNKDCGKSRFGSVCVAGKDSVKRCRRHECNIDVHCNRNNQNPDTWGYCLRNTLRQRVCVFKKKCVKDSECNDFNSCTKDVCLSEYGFCKNIKRCNDGNPCTVDVCTPCGEDNKSYKCKNTKKSCTVIKEMLSQKLFGVLEKDRSKWLGKCSKAYGCRTCIVHAQCDDNNGCTADSCENQRCVHKPIHNEWCDPKLPKDKQPINFQSVVELRDATKLELSGPNTNN